MARTQMVIAGVMLSLFGSFMIPGQAMAVGVAKDEQDCELLLDLSYNAGTSNLTPSVKSEPVCIKKYGLPISIPQTILLFMVADSAHTRFGYFCRQNVIDCTETQSDVLVKNICATREKFVKDNPPDSSGFDSEKYKYACEWNNVFHNYYPFDIHISTKEPPATGTASKRRQISDYIQLIRVYRNGTLAYVWNGPANDDRGAELVIPGNGLTAARLPHRSDFDLRIIPHGVEVDESVLAERATAHSSRWQSELSRLKTATITTLIAENKQLEQINAIHKNMVCIIEHTKALVAVASALSGDIQYSDTKLSKEAKNACGDISSLKELYSEKDKHIPMNELFSQLKTGKIKSIDDLNTLIKDSVSQLSKLSQSQMKDYIDNLKMEMIHKINASTIASEKKVQLILEIENLVSVYSGVANMLPQIRQLAETIRKDAVRIASDPAEQARLFAKFADSLEDQSSLFEARGRNPKYLSGEKILRMEYGDPHQFFFMAPWNMISLRWGDNPGTSLGVENLVPAIDLVGYRYQWGRSRFADLRIALGGVFIKDRLPAPDPSQPGQLADKDFYNFSAELNIGLGGFKIGAGYIVTDNLPSEPMWSANRIRILLGADLVKLISGQNAEIR